MDLPDYHGPSLVAPVSSLGLPPKKAVFPHFPRISASSDFARVHCRPWSHLVHLPACHPGTSPSSSPLSALHLPQARPTQIGPFTEAASPARNTRRFVR